MKKSDRIMSLLIRVAFVYLVIWIAAEAITTNDYGLWFMALLIFTIIVLVSYILFPKWWLTPSKKKPVKRLLLWLSNKIQQRYGVQRIKRGDTILMDGNHYKIIGLESCRNLCREAAPGSGCEKEGEA